MESRFSKTVQDILKNISTIQSDISSIKTELTNLNTRINSMNHLTKDVTINGNSSVIVTFDSVQDYLARDIRVLVYDDDNSMWINSESVATVGFVADGYKIINETDEKLHFKIILN